MVRRGAPESVPLVSAARMRTSFWRKHRRPKRRTLQDSGNSSLCQQKQTPALEKATQLLAEKLKGDAELNLGDVAYTTQVGRQVFAHRRVALCTDTADAVSVLESLEPARVVNGFHEGTAPAVVFLFPGQGTQYVNMARELYESETGFRVGSRQVRSAAQASSGSRSARLAVSV